MLLRVCTFCRQPLEQTSKDPRYLERVTHGICGQCAERYLAGSGESMQAFLDCIKSPVLLVDDDGRPLLANHAAHDVLTPNMLSNLGSYGGEVFGCIHADNPERCGQTVHCKSCTIRNAVEHTRDTGQATINIPALAELASVTGSDKICFHISTEKVGDYILLRIDDIDRAA